MKHKPKEWWWKLTWPFAHNNYTTIAHTIYYPKSVGGVPISIEAHECVHERQQEEVGIIKFIFLYLFVCPFLWNPWRYKWEYEAFTKGSCKSSEDTKRILRSRAYGWLVFHA